ncbi:hypothetical protein FRB99_000469 [Tulasnella sp. 403]|nr:hypothetical protein FRB99_000469 [Tulasnella sp. 403]
MWRFDILIGWIEQLVEKVDTASERVGELEQSNRHLSDAIQALTDRMLQDQVTDATQREGAPSPSLTSPAGPASLPLPPLRISWSGDNVLVDERGDPVNMPNTQDVLYRNICGDQWVPDAARRSF